MEVTQSRASAFYLRDYMEPEDFKNFMENVVWNEGEEDIDSIEKRALEVKKEVSKRIKNIPLKRGDVLYLKRGRDTCEYVFCYFYNGTKLVEWIVDEDIPRQFSVSKARYHPNYWKDAEFEANYRPNVVNILKNVIKTFKKREDHWEVELGGTIWKCYIVDDDHKRANVNTDFKNGYFEPYKDNEFYFVVQE